MQSLKYISIKVFCQQLFINNFKEKSIKNKLYIHIYEGIKYIFKIK